VPGEQRLWYSALPPAPGAFGIQAPPLRFVAISKGFSADGRPRCGHNARRSQVSDHALLRNAPGLKAPPASASGKPPEMAAFF